MSVGAAVSASTGSAYICVEHLEPAISSHPPNAKAAVVMLRLLQNIFLLLGRSHRISVMGSSPQTALSHSGQWGAPLFFDKIDSHLQPGHCVNILT